MEKLFSALMLVAILGLLGIDLQLAGLLHYQFSGAADVASMFGP